MMNITLRQLRAFTSVAQLGGFSAAAARLHLTQSAVSMLVHSLEKELGMALFDRTTRSVKLTAEGSNFLPLAEKMLLDLHTAVADTRARAERTRGRLVIAVLSAFAATLLPEILRRYRDHHPEVQVTVRDDTSPQKILAMVQNGDADLGICSLDRGAWGLLVVDVLMDDALILACPPANRLAQQENVEWADLQHEKLIAFPCNNAIQSLIDGTSSALGLRLSNVCEVTSTSTALALTSAGLGVSVLPLYSKLLRPDARVCYRALVNPIVRRDLCLLRLRDRAMPPAAQACVKILLEQRQALKIATL